uniref:MIF4G domain-containing protein n=1 Tax=Panagrolaimus superbus TaxID=310955 RepID=A0A914Z0Q1_9BILA
MLSTIKFMSHLFRIELLNYKIIENCIVILIRNAEQSGSELMTEYAVELMKHGGPFIVERKEDTSKLDGYVTYLDKLKSSVSNRVKFMIMDLTDLRDKKWVDKRVGPKTKDEVDMYIQKKLEQNKREQIVIEQDRKRSKDDKKARANAAAADQHRKRSNFIDKQRQTYVSRLSVDKKDRLNAAAAAAASASASGSALKNTSLLKIDKLRLGSTKKWGNPNTNTTSSTPSQNDKSASRVMARQSADARYNT